MSNESNFFKSFTLSPFPSINEGNISNEDLFSESLQPKSDKQLEISDLQLFDTEPPEINPKDYKGDFC